LRHIGLLAADETPMVATTRRLVVAGTDRSDHAQRSAFMSFRRVRNQDGGELAHVVSADEASTVLRWNGRFEFSDEIMQMTDRQPAAVSYCHESGLMFLARDNAPIFVRRAYPVVRVMIARVHPGLRRPLSDWLFRVHQIPALAAAHPLFFCAGDEVISVESIVQLTVE
jgi:hypothetical protein